MATKLVDHGLGPTHPHLIEEYKQEFGRDPKEDFPNWESGHKTLMIGGGIPGIENVGGDLDAVTGKEVWKIDRVTGASKENEHSYASPKGIRQHRFA